MPSRSTVAGLHRIDTNNVGDSWSSPWHYFSLGVDRILDVDAVPVGDLRSCLGGTVIAGGGGLLGHCPKWDGVLSSLPKRAHRAIAWGVGLGTPLRPFTASQHLRHWTGRVHSILGWDGRGREARHAALPDYLAGFDLVGVRDDLPGMRARWVPCASCMHPAMVKSRDVTRRVGVFEHKGVPIRLDHSISPDDRMKNTGADIAAALDFIASCEVLVTSSYHGAYWGTLLGKRVIVYRPFSVKFLHMRHPPTIYSGTLVTDIARSRAYPEALEACRAVNLRFYEDVLEVMHATRRVRTKPVRPQEPPDSEVWASGWSSERSPVSEASEREMRLRHRGQT